MTQSIQRCPEREAADHEVSGCHTAATPAHPPCSVIQVERSQAYLCQIGKYRRLSSSTRTRTCHRVCSCRCTLEQRLSHVVQVLQNTDSYQTRVSVHVICNEAAAMKRVLGLWELSATVHQSQDTSGAASSTQPQSEPYAMLWDHRRIIEEAALTGRHIESRSQPCKTSPIKTTRSAISKVQGCTAPTSTLKTTQA